MFCFFVWLFFLFVFFRSLNTPVWALGLRTGPRSLSTPQCGNIQDFAQFVQWHKHCVTTWREPRRRRTEKKNCLVCGERICHIWAVWALFTLIFTAYAIVRTRVHFRPRQRKKKNLRENLQTLQQQETFPAIN